MGLAKGAGSVARKSLIVRVPAWHEDPAQGRVRLREVFAAGADGITFPHVENLNEAKQILAAAQAEKINVWSPDNPKGDKLLMMMLEDPSAVAQAAEFANLKGYSILACGIGSLRGALKGDGAAAEAGTQKVLAETKRARLPNMLTANAKDVEQRIKEGFLGFAHAGTGRRRGNPNRQESRRALAGPLSPCAKILLEIRRGDPDINGFLCRSEPASGLSVDHERQRGRIADTHHRFVLDVEDVMLAGLQQPREHLLSIDPDNHPATALRPELHAQRDSRDSRGIRAERVILSGPRSIRRGWFLQGGLRRVLRVVAAGRPEIPEVGD